MFEPWPIYWYAVFLTSALCRRVARIDAGLVGRTKQDLRFRGACPQASEDARIRAQHEQDLDLTIVPNGLVSPARTSTAALCSLAPRPGEGSNKMRTPFEQSFDIKLAPLLQLFAIANRNRGISKIESTSEGTEQAAHRSHLQSRLRGSRGGSREQGARGRQGRCAGMSSSHPPTVVKPTRSASPTTLTELKATLRRR